MPKLEYKKNDLYDGTASYNNVMYTEQELEKLKSEVYDFEKKLSKKYQPYNSEYSYELGLYLSSKLSEYSFVEGERHKFWNMLREYVNEKDKRKVFQSNQREPYEYCYMLSKLDKNLVTKFSRSRWDHLFDCVTAREDSRLYKWLLELNNEKFISSSEYWRAFVKGLNIYFKNLDTSIFNEEEIFKIYEEVMLKSMFLVDYIKENAKLSNEVRNKFFINSKNTSGRDIDSLNKILKSLL